MIKRWLTILGLDVDHICNLTDIDDKIIKRTIHNLNKTIPSPSQKPKKSKKSKNK